MSFRLVRNPVKKEKMSDEKIFGIYIMGNDRPTLYVGVTNNLIRRIWEHKNNKGGAFTQKYKLNKLLYYEFTETPYQSIIREKQIKNMTRKGKLELIKNKNPRLFDISGEIFSLCETNPDELFRDTQYF